jgi:hypothetical protein
MNAMVVEGSTSKTCKGKNVGTQRSASERGHGSSQHSGQQVPLQGKVTLSNHSETALTLNLAVLLKIPHVSQRGSLLTLRTNTQEDRRHSILILTNCIPSEIIPMQFETMAQRIPTRLKL